MISFDVDIAISGSRDYGITVLPTSFQPGCNAYGRLANGSTTFSANATDGSGVHATLQFSPLAAGVVNPFPVAAYQNMTNQPIFGNGSTCDSQVRLFNSTINQGEFAPVPVVGSVVSNLPPFDYSVGVDGVFGLLVDTPFVEFNYLDCQTLKGYTATGSGD